MSSDDELNEVLTKFGVPSGLTKVDRSERDRWRVLRKDLKHLIHKKQLQASLDELKTLLEVAKDKDNVRPNWVAKITLENRIKQLEKGK